MFLALQFLIKVKGHFLCCMLFFVFFCVCKAASRKPKEMLIFGEAPHTDSSLWTEVSFCVSVALSSLCRYGPKAPCFSQLAGCKVLLRLGSIHNTADDSETFAKGGASCTTSEMQLCLSCDSWKSSNSLFSHSHCA